MFPLLPILILFLLGPANAERLAGEGRLPAALLAIHRTMVPVVANVAVEEELPETAARPSGKQPLVAPEIPFPAEPLGQGGFEAGWPTRAGPSAA